MVDEDGYTYFTPVAATKSAKAPKAGGKAAAAPVEAKASSADTAALEKQILGYINTKGQITDT